MDNSETHFMFSCNFYEELRTMLCDNIVQVYPQFLELNDNEKLKILMRKYVVKRTAKYVWEAYEKRRAAMYRSTTM